MKIELKIGALLCNIAGDCVTIHDVDDLNVYGMADEMPYKWLKATILEGIRVGVLIYDETPIKKKYIKDLIEE